MEYLTVPQVESIGKRICDAIEADVKRAQARVAAVDAQPVPARMFIRMDGKRGRQRIHLYVTGVSFAAGDGYKIDKVSYTDKSVKAKQFNAELGLAIARQLAERGALNTTLEAK